MSIFSRSFNRHVADSAARRTKRPRRRILIFEPLEDRRLLAHAPLNFTVSNAGGPGVNLSWTDNGATGYEIQSSVNGLNDEANPIAWKTGLWRTTKTEPAGSQDSNFDRFRAYYYRIQALPATNPPHWSTIEYTTAPPEDNVVKVSAAVLPGVEMITLRWPEELKFASSTYTISRKAKDDLAWTELVSSDTGNDWVDFDVEEGKAYEYEVKRSSPSGTGYVYAGLELALEDVDSTIESPGTVILVIDETQIDPMQPDDVIAEVDRLKQDLFAEGWDVEVIDDVNPNDTPADVRTKIKMKYDNDPTNVKAVFLIGHIPVPMSGSSSPDGHVPSRPMPADVYYGDMDSTWTFNENTVPTDADGKPVELMVGRADMSGMSAFSESETELLRRYLDKDHAFRSGQVAVKRKARIRDRFAKTNSSTGAWQTLSGFFGPATNPEPDAPDNIDVNKWTDTTWPLVTGLSSIVSGDFTGDPNVDSSVEIVTASADDNRIAWYDRDSQGNLLMHVVSDEVRHVSSVLLADLDGDGNDDILSASLVVNASANTTFDQILWYDHVGTPTPTFQNRGDVVADSDPTDTGAWQTLSGLFGPAANPTPTEPDHINVSKWEDTGWTRRVTLPRGRMCWRPRWTTLSLAL